MGLRGTGQSYAAGGVWTAPFVLDGQVLKPLTIMTWVRDTAASSPMGGFYGGFGNPGGVSYIALQTADNIAYADEQDGTPTEAYAQVPLAGSSDTWRPLIGVFGGPASRTVYDLNGITDTNGTTLAAQPLTLVTLGSFVTNGGTYLDCPPTTIMAEFAVWRAALGPQEVALLQSGVSPLQVRREALFCYFPLRNSLLDLGPLRLPLQGPAPVYAGHPPVAAPRAAAGRSVLRAAASLIAGPRLIWLG